MKKLFSVENEGCHKVFNVLGIKAKFSRKNLVANLSENDYEKYLKKWFLKRTGKHLNLENPQTFSEKIQWLKLYNSTPLKTELADKYKVRNWVKEQIGEEYLIPILGVWQKFEDIDFDKLPEKFVLKANHGCGWNIIVKNKDKFDKEKAKKKFHKWLNTNYASRAGLELHYNDIKPLIVAEQYLETPDGDLKDYKFLCFNGQVKYIWVDKDRQKHHRRNLYDTEWNLLPVKIAYENFTEPCAKPHNLDKMIEFANKMSKDFAFVRVDFYEHDNHLYFGEMTFTSGSGVKKFIPEEYDYKLGEMIDLTNIKKIMPKRISNSPQVIVSLTSFPYRIPTIHLTIESLLSQTMKPDMIILWLAKEQFPNLEKDLPESLLKLQKDGLTIKWCNDIRSYKKLIPTLKEYPDDIIITVDDDCIYHKDMVKRLYKSYLKNPEYIHCHRTTKILLNNDNSFTIKGKKFYKKPSFANKLVGVGGVLYPPHSLYKDVTNEELFTTLAPTNDDIWFWLMAVKNNTKIAIIKKHIIKPKEIKIVKQGPCLCNINDKGTNLFSKDLNNILNHYTELKEIITKSVKEDSCK